MELEMHACGCTINCELHTQCYLNVSHGSVTSLIVQLATSQVWLKLEVCRILPHKDKAILYIGDYYWWFTLAVYNHPLNQAHGKYVTWWNGVQIANGYVGVKSK